MLLKYTLTVALIFYGVQGNVCHEADSLLEPKNDNCFADLPDPFVCDRVSESLMEQVLEVFVAANNALKLPGIPKVGGYLSKHTVKQSEDDCQILFLNLNKALLETASKFAALTEYLTDSNEFFDQITNAQKCVNSIFSITLEILRRHPSGDLTSNVSFVQQQYIVTVQNKVESEYALFSKLTDESVDLLVTFIKFGDYKAAIEQLKRVQTIDPLARVIEKFSAGDSHQFKNLLLFAFELENFTKSIQIYESVARIVMRDPKTHIYDIIALGKVFEEEKARCPNDTEDCKPSGFEMVDTIVEGLTKYFIASTADSICKNFFTSIIQTLSPTVNTTLLPIAFTTKIEEVIEAAFKTRQNHTESCELKHIINFVGSLNWNQHKPPGFKALLYQDYETFGIENMFLSYDILRSAMDNLNGPDLELRDKVKEELDTIMNDKIPNVVKLLSAMNETTVLIKASGKCLVTMASELYAGNMAVNLNTCSEISKWKLIPAGLGRFTFILKQVGEKQGLQLSSHIPWRNKKDKKLGFVTASKERVELSQQYYAWKIIAQESAGELKVSLYHMGRKALLGSYPSNEVYLDLAADFADTSNHWDLEVVQDSLV